MPPNLLNSLTTLNSIKTQCKNENVPQIIVSAPNSLHQTMAQEEFSSPIVTSNTSSPKPPAQIMIHNNSSQTSMTTIRPSKTIRSKATNFIKKVKSTPLLQRRNPIADRLDAICAQKEFAWQLDRPSNWHRMEQYRLWIRVADWFMILNQKDIENQDGAWYWANDIEHQFPMYY